MNRPLTHIVTSTTTTTTTTTFHQVTHQATMLTMSDDDSSRDSGICEMDEGAATCFSLVNTATVEECMMEVDEAPVVNVPKPTRSSRSIPLRKEKSACRVLFDKSPNSRNTFVRPLCILHPNRKRSLEETVGWPMAKKEKNSERTLASDHYHLESMTETPDDDDIQLDEDEGSQPGPFVEETVRTSTKFAKPALFRHHSTTAVSESRRDEVEDRSHLVVDYRLKTLGNGCSTSYRRITADTLCNIMSNMTEKQFTEMFLLIDCRYPFEYDGGHIRNSVNYFDRDKVCELFFDKNGKKHNKIPIFYCEFSQKRGPSMANALRSEDRVRNVAIYPHCSFEEMYVLDKGFRNFHEFVTSTNQGRFCEPFAYIQMHDNRFTSELKKWNYHRRAMPGQSVFRAESSTLIRSSVSYPSVRAGTVLAAKQENSQDSQRKDKTPGVPRTASRRQLFTDITNSPTNFDRSNAENMMRSPSPPSSNVPLQNPQWT